MTRRRHSRRRSIPAPRITYRWRLCKVQVGENIYIVVGRRITLHRGSWTAALTKAARLESKYERLARRS